MARTKQTVERRPPSSQRIRNNPVASPSSSSGSSPMSEGSSDSSNDGKPRRRRVHNTPPMRAPVSTKLAKKSEKSKKRPRKSSTSKITSSPAMKRSKKSNTSPIFISSDSSSSSPGVSLMGNGKYDSPIKSNVSDASSMQLRIPSENSNSGSSIVILPAYSKSNTYSPLQSRISNYASQLPSSLSNSSSTRFNVNQYGTNTEIPNPRPWMNSQIPMNLNNPNEFSSNFVSYYPSTGQMSQSDVNYMNSLIKSGKLKRSAVPEYVRKANDYLRTINQAQSSGAM